MGRRRSEVTTRNNSHGRFVDATCLNNGSIFFRSEVTRLFRFGWNFPFAGPILGVFCHETRLVRMNFEFCEVELTSSNIFCRTRDQARI
jgi:hypothetical protein